MTMASKAEDVVIFSTFLSFVMFLLAIVSMFMTGSYLATGEVEAWASMGACMVGMFALLVLISAMTIPVALRLARRSGSKETLRALYIYILLPVVFIGVMVGNAANYFLNVLIFGWPLFLVSGVLMLLAANWVRVEAGMAGLKVRCGACGRAFEMDDDEEYGFCDHCSAPNWNPLRPRDRAGAEGTKMAYQAEGVAPAAFTRGGGEALGSLVASTSGFLLVTSAVSLVGGLAALYAAWDLVETLLGALFAGAGGFGLYAYYTVITRRSFLAPVVASTLLVICAFVAFAIFDVCGILLGGFAVVTFFLSFQLWMRTGRGRKVRVPAGTVADEVRLQARGR